MTEGLVQIGDNDTLVLSWVSQWLADEEGELGCYKLLVIKQDDGLFRALLIIEYEDGSKQLLGDKRDELAEPMIEDIKRAVTEEAPEAEWEEGVRYEYQPVGFPPGIGQIEWF